VIDGGTTNTRARLVVEGAIRAKAVRPVGVRDAALAAGSGLDPLAQAVAGAVAEVMRASGQERPVFLVASGMLTSEVGLCTVPHLEAPVGLEDLARGAAMRTLEAISETPILFIPGVRTTASAVEDDGWADADVLRGEECETVGAWTALAPDGPAALLWPGSHTKLVAVDGRGRITASVTTLAGELLSAVARHTLVAASLPSELPDEPDLDAAAEGARLAAARGLGRAAFLVRLAALSRRWGPAARAAFWMGAVVGDDVAHLRSHRLLAGDIPLWVGGRQPLRSLYAELLAETRLGPVAALADDLAETASVRGALAIAAQRPL
jgi:2-dehydro-3-deoxygalactonokinase